MGWDSLVGGLELTPAVRAWWPLDQERSGGCWARPPASPGAFDPSLPPPKGVSVAASPAAVSPRGLIGARGPVFQMGRLRRGVLGPLAGESRLPAGSGAGVGGVQSKPRGCPAASQGGVLGTAPPMFRPACCPSRARAGQSGGEPLSGGVVSLGTIPGWDSSLPARGGLLLRLSPGPSDVAQVTCGWRNWNISVLLAPLSLASKASVMVKVPLVPWEGTQACPSRPLGLRADCWIGPGPGPLGLPALGRGQGSAGLGRWPSCQTSVGCAPGHFTDFLFEPGTQAWTQMVRLPSTRPLTLHTISLSDFGA